MRNSESPFAAPLNPLITQDRDFKHRCRASGIEVRIMLAGQREIDTPGVSDRTSILTLERMSTAEGIIHMTDRASLIGRTVERNNAPSTTIRIATIALAMSDIVDAVSDVLVVAGQTILEANVERLFGTITPRLIIGHAGPADVHH